MIFDVFSILDNLPKYRRNKVLGYSSEDLKKIESLYGIQVSGDFKAFLLKAGRCDGGLFGDNPIILYRETWNARTHILFQYTFFSDLQDIGAWEFLKKPFVFSVESETQYYFLITGINDGLVYHYDENTENVSCTNKVLSEYLMDVIQRYCKLELINEEICRGDLLNI